MAATSSSKSPPSSSSATDAETLRRDRFLSSKLYLNVPPSKVPLIYSTSYDITFLGIEKLHPFDSSKWRRICQFLTTEGTLDKNKIVEPVEASHDDLLVVHSESYLRSLKSSLKVSIIIEVSPNGVISRDEMVFRFAKEKNLPLVMLTSGGYMKSRAQVIADSIANLSKKSLIDLDSAVSSI